jgi:hypothetical protein
MIRRSFLGRSVSAAAATIVPRHVLGGPRFVAPSAKITMACIGVGAQRTRVMMDLLAHPDVQVVAVCDVNEESADYVEWSPHELRDKERALLGGRHADWGADWKGPTAGREPARSFEFAGPITEAPLLGNVALRLGRNLRWDPAALSVPDVPDAQVLVRPEYRPGWTL